MGDTKSKRGRKAKAAEDDETPQEWEPQEIILDENDAATMKIIQDQLNANKQKYDIANDELNRNLQMTQELQERNQHLALQLTSLTGAINDLDKLKAKLAEPFNEKYNVPTEVNYELFAGEGKIKRVILKGEKVSDTSDSNN